MIKDLEIARHNLDLKSLAPVNPVKDVDPGKGPLVELLDWDEDHDEDNFTPVWSKKKKKSVKWATSSGQKKGKKAGCGQGKHRMVGGKKKDQLPHELLVTGPRRRKTPDRFK